MLLGCQPLVSYQNNSYAKTSQALRALSVYDVCPLQVLAMECHE